MNSSTPNDESFRDHIATINDDGKRNWIYAQKPVGRLYNIRTYLSWVYLAVFFSLPFVRINGDPFFLFNVLERKFILFGVTFWPQDLFILGLGFLVFIVFVVLFTVVYGRVFCGWACPQTIFMEMVFRKIEYLIEGDAAHQRVLDKAPWTSKKFMKRILKHLVFFLIAFLIANTFLAYVIGTDELFKIVREPVSKHMGGFIAIVIFSGVFYAVYAWFREQVCLIVCPYGRLQGVMTDKDTILVAYDYNRGEPREKFSKDPERKTGTCIDCFQCVKVCPTGIDIRNGTQLECTNCTACIDACEVIMQKTWHEPSLISYASENNLQSGTKFRITPRIKAYTAVLVVLMGVLATLLITRKDVQGTLLRTPGLLYQEQSGNMVSNLYNYKLINKTHRDIPVHFELEDQKGWIKVVGKQPVVRKSDETAGSLFIFLPASEIHKRKTKLRVVMYDAHNRRITTLKTTFIGPIN